MNIIENSLIDICDEKLYIKALYKYTYCYQEGKRIGFVPVIKTDIDGEKHYSRCPGDEYPAGHLLFKCMRCPYLNADYSKERQKLAEKVEFEKFENMLNPEGVDCDGINSSL